MTTKSPAPKPKRRRKKSKNHYFTQNDIDSFLEEAQANAPAGEGDTD